MILLHCGLHIILNNIFYTSDGYCKLSAVMCLLSCVFSLNDFQNNWIIVNLFLNACSHDWWEWAVNMFLSTFSTNYTIMVNILLNKWVFISGTCWSKVYLWIIFLSLCLFSSTSKFQLCIRCPTDLFVTLEQCMHVFGYVFMIWTTLTFQFDLTMVWWTMIKSRIGYFLMELLEQ